MRNIFYVVAIGLLALSTIIPNLALAVESTTQKSYVTATDEVTEAMDENKEDQLKVGDVTIAKNGYTTKDGVPNAPKPETNLSANPSDKSQINVSTWAAFQSAVTNRTINTIFVQADLYNTTNTRAVSTRTRSLKIHGNGHYIDFRDTSFEMNTAVPRDSNFLLQMNNITMYGYNYYGPFSVWSAPSSGSKMVLSYNDVTYVGTQLTASWDWDIEFMGTVENHAVNSYISPYNGIEQSGNKNQENVEATNLTIRDNAHYNGTSENASVIILGKGKKTGTMKIGDHADVTITAFRNEAYPDVGERGASALYLEGKLITGENAELTIHTRQTGNQHAIHINEANNGFTANKGSIIKLYSTGPSGPKQLLKMEANTTLTIEDHAELHLIAKNKGSNGNSLLTVEDNSKFIIGKKGTLNAISDGVGTQTILYFGAGSVFRFADAKRVNIQYINPAVSPDSVLFKMGGSTGKLDVDVQSVRAWNKMDVASNSTREPDFIWDPMFNMVTTFTSGTSTSRKGQTIYQQLYDDYMKNFFPENFSRLEYREIAHVFLENIREVNDNIEGSNSTTLTGKTNPGAFIRVKGDPALPDAEIPSGIIGSDDEQITANYTVRADDDGYFTVHAKKGQYFTANNEIEIFAFRSGKTATARVKVLDKNPPTGDGRKQSIVKGNTLPIAKQFVVNEADTNPDNTGYTYRFKEDYSALVNEVGIHNIIVILIDDAGNEREIPVKLGVLTSNYQITAEDFTVNLSELRKSDNIKDFLLTKSKAQAWAILNFEEVDVTKDLIVADLSTIEQYKKGSYSITLSLKVNTETVKKKFTVKVLDDEGVSPTNPENPGSSEPNEQENIGTGQTGLLKLDYAPSTFDFGEVKYGFNSTTAHGKKTTSEKQWLQVSDNREEKNITSWSIVASENMDLTNKNGDALKGAYITLPKGKNYNEATGNMELNSGQLSSNEVELSTTPQIVFSASNMQEKMRNISTNVWNVDDVTLKIPGGQDFKEDNYSNTINWTLVGEPTE